MAEYSTHPETYISLSRKQTVAACVAALPVAQRSQFLRFAEMLSAWFNYQFHLRLENLKTQFLGSIGDGAHAFTEQLESMALDANFSPIQLEELTQSLENSSLFKVRLHVDFSDFYEVKLFSRGQSLQRETVPKWFGLAEHEIEFVNYDRVLVYLRYTGTGSVSETAASETSKSETTLKLFQNVPRADLEMLFPNTQVRMRLKDKLLIGVPAFVGGLIVLTTKLGGSLLLLAAIFSFWLGIRSEPVELNQTNLLVLATGAGALGAYLFKQFGNFKNRKIRFMKTLTENLYFKNLDNDLGVLVNLVDYAAASENKEVLLAYAELLLQTHTRATLAEAVEQRLGKKGFDIEGALQKLTELELVTFDADEQIIPHNLTNALQQMDKRWDNLFDREGYS